MKAFFTINEIKKEYYFLRSSLMREDSFARNFSSVFIGKAVIIAITLFTTPLLTRLYSPEAYGYFSFFNTVVINFAMLSTMGFPFALVLAKSEHEFYNLMVFLVVAVFFFLIVFGALFLLCMNFVVPFDFENHDESNLYFILLVFGAMIFAWVQIFPRWNTWRNQYKTGARINVVVNAGARGVSLAIGFFFDGFKFGLILGDIAGKLAGIAINFYVNVRKEWSSIIRAVSRPAMMAMVRQYQNYPQYILSGVYLAMLCNHIPLLVFSFYFGAEILGNYALTTGLMNLPVTLLAQSLGAVFLKRVADLQTNSPDKISPFIKRLTTGIFLAVILPYAIIVVFAPQIFILLLGEDWFIAGQYASILALYGPFELLLQSVQNALQVFNREKLIFKLNLFQLILVILFVLPGLYFHSPGAVVWGLAAAKMISSYVILFAVLKTGGINPWLLFKFIIAFGALVVFLLSIEWLATS